MDKKLKNFIFIITIIMMIVILKFGIANAIGNEYISKTYIDYPENNSTEIDQITVKGWVMTNDTKSEIKIYVDGNEKEIISKKRIQREDVIKAIKDYGSESENPTPGFEYTISIKDLKKGQHTLTVESVSRNQDVMSKYNVTFNVGSYTAKMYIDTPTSGQTVSNANIVEGWAMSNDKEISFKAYIDNQEQEIKSIERVTRQDVLNAIKGYGDVTTSPKPGFKIEIDFEKLQAGKHELRIDVISNEGDILSTEKQQIIIEQEKAKMYIDSPTQGKEISANDIIEGWVMSNKKDTEIKVFIDDIEQTIETLERVERQDVLNAIKGYGNSVTTPNPGFKIKINMESIKDGQHNLKIQVISKGGNILTEEIEKITIKKYNARTYIDYPENNDPITKDATISGWIMTNDLESKIKVYVDEKEKEVLNLERNTRDDVIKAIQGYGGIEYNKKPGFSFNLNLEDISEGQHELKLEIISRENVVLTTVKQKIVVEEEKAKMYIDSPAQGNRLLIRDYIEGWVMSNDTNISLKVFLDNEEKEIKEIQRTERQDVLNAIKGYGNKRTSPNPGFKLKIDIEDIKEGAHELKIQVISKQGKVLTTSTENIIVQKYNTRIDVDNPSKTRYAPRELSIEGWVMSEAEDKTVNIKFDNDVIENVEFGKRQDVINVIKDCGGEEKNPTPGFSAKVDLSKYSKGEHIITIEVISNKTNEIIKTTTRKITIVDEIQRDVQTYGRSGASINGRSDGSELQYFKFGSGPNVFVGVFCVHGYEDSWSRDGTVLVNIANDFYNRLLEEQDFDLADKWTIYVIPEVNPDGRKLGWTKDGPGRTTLYSKVGKGIDINRSWQTGTDYIKYNDARNYNGTEGFQAYEAEYLRNFLLSHKSTNGQTVLVDLHGWENQLIGTEQVCSYYKQEYTSCSTRNYGKYGTQYLITWARQNLGAKSALVELPYASSQSEVNRMQLSEKYINATLKMLREI